MQQLLRPAPFSRSSWRARSRVYSRLAEHPAESRMNSRSGQGAEPAFACRRLAGFDTVGLRLGVRMPEIFISYARSTAAQAQKIADALRGLGYDVWRDDELPVHRSYTQVIEERLKSAKAVVVVWS